MVQMKTKRLRTAPYSVVNANFREFEGIFRDSADIALMQGAHGHEAKRMGSRKKNTRSWCKRCPNLSGLANQAHSHRGV